MRVSRAIAAGVIGALVVLSLVWIVGWVQGVDTDLCALTAAVVFGSTGGAAWLGGFVIQLVVGAVAALVYGALFEWVTARAGGWVGFAIGVAHAILAGLAVGFLPGDRILDAGLTPPGAFYEYRGAWCLVAFVCAHLFFGIFVGRVYGDTEHQPSRETRRWAEVPRP